MDGWISGLVGCEVGGWLDWWISGLVGCRMGGLVDGWMDGAAVESEHWLMVVGSESRAKGAAMFGCVFIVILQFLASMLTGRVGHPLSMQD